MLIVEYETGGVCKEQQFSNNKKGSFASIKFIEQLYNDRRKHPFYCHLDKIKRLDAKLKDRPSRNMKIMLEVEIKALEEDRLSTLYLLDLPNKEPPAITVKIFKK